MPPPTAVIMTLDAGIIFGLGSIFGFLAGAALVGVIAMVRR